MKIYAFADEASAMIDGQIAAMQRNGLNGLEIRNVDGTNVADITPDKAREVRCKLDSAGLVTWSIGSPIGKIHLETGDFSAHLERFKNVIEVAHILGASNIRMFSFFIAKGADPASCKNEVFDCLGQLVDIAQGSGIDLCHENEKGIYGDLACRCVEIHQAFPTLKAVFDPANFVQCGQDTWQAWEMLHPFVKYIHVKDALADGNVVPSGRGIGNVERIISDFRASGGNDLSVEPHLTVFDGLAGLEENGDVSKIGRFVYPSSDHAFDAACNALKALL